MRLSTRLMANAATTYVRMGTTFLLGIFMLWYLIDRVGLVGVGMISLVTGAFGVGALDAAVRQSVVRELAASIASGDQKRLQSTLVSGLAYCVPAGVVFALIYGLIALAAWMGFFNVPDELVGSLVTLLLVEGAIFGTRMALAPYSQAIFAARRVGIDNVLVVLDRCTNIIAALLAFSVIWPDAELPVMLSGFALIRFGVAMVETLFEVLLARCTVDGLRFRRSAFDRALFRTIAGTVWHSGQMTVLALASPKLVLVLVNLFFGLTFNGIWHVVTTVRGHASMIADGVLRGIDPVAAHLAEEGRQDTVVDLMVRGVRYQLLAILPFAVCYAIFLVPVLTLWVGGRLAQDESVLSGSVSVDGAIRLMAVMGAIGLFAEVIRAGTRGVERMLFGVGEIRSYAWFAKYAALINVGGAALLMWILDDVMYAPIPLAIANAAYFGVVIPRAAARCVQLPLSDVVRLALWRPCVIAVILGAGVYVARMQMPTLSVGSLLALLAGIGTAYVALVFVIGLDGQERRRVLELLRRSGRR